MNIFFYLLCLASVSVSGCELLGTNKSLNDSDKEYVYMSDEHRAIVVKCAASPEFWASSGDIGFAVEKLKSKGIPLSGWSHPLLYEIIRSIEQNPIDQTGWTALERFFKHCDGEYAHLGGVMIGLIKGSTIPDEALREHGFSIPELQPPPEWYD